jgi:hypothetical protein
MSALTWKCHVCGDERPDALIGVFSKEVELAGGVMATQNVRYCLDRESCVEGAKQVDWLKEAK